ncbi:hypothetical protein E5676_scaffold775G00300 [Cucumis melo var. makuwa]|uniref:Uncharacterized protein n=1 Tax=Cucumis melo var. makuwa TaxID=1194695 RepID=A0A5D3BQQ7_CUCMM|nr:hypothetical protein E6C27_scaffold744G00730 [Cucumis melo var. makuwa]TYK01707.1 hypothetical protein E5676_scaffold775G00300 [Cucumis melo var. makuwa]
MGDLILTNHENEDYQNRKKVKFHVITSPSLKNQRTPKEDMEDVSQGLKDGGQSTVDEQKRSEEEKKKPYFRMQLVPKSHHLSISAIAIHAHLSYGVVVAAISFSGSPSCYDIGHLRFSLSYPLYGQPSSALSHL